MNSRKSLYADLCLFLVAIIWGSGFIFTKTTLDSMTPYYLTTFRFVIPTIMLSIIFFKKLKNIRKEDIKAGIIIGLCLFGGFATQTVGLNYTTASKQAFITATNVVMVPFIYWIMSKKRPDSYDVVAAFICLLGIGILSIEKSLTIGYGDFLTLICAVFFAFHICTVGHFAKDKDPIILTIIQLGTVSILSLIFALLFEPKIVQVQREAVFSIFYLGIFSTLVAFLIQTIAQKYTSSTHTAIILSFEAVFGSIFSIIFLKEPFTIRFLIGCLSILLSVITSETKWEFLKKKRWDKV